MKCSHIDCSRDKRDWLNVNSHPGSDIKLHPWCKNCGIVKNISDDKCYSIGFWMNVLSRISNRYSIKQVQKRIISKYLKSHDYFNDKYYVTGSSQQEIFKNIVSKYCCVNIKSIESFFY